MSTPPPRRHSAWFLAVTYAALVVYASLHPFDGWQDLSQWSWAWLWLPWPHYWGGFDIVANVLGYGPLGALLTLVARACGLRRVKSMLAAVMVAALLSWGLEVTQSLLPVRVPSRLDWLLNVAGACLGALLVEGLAALGWLSWVAALQDRWWRADDGGGLALLLLWPVALSVPTPVPLALGQFFDRAMRGVLDWAAGSSFEGFLMWSELPPPPLTPLAEMLITTLGGVAPCLIVLTVIRRPIARLGLTVCVVLAGVAATALATTLRLGPQHAMTWVTQQTGLSLQVAAAVLFVLAWLPTRAVAAIGLMGMTLGLQLVNAIPMDPYVQSSLLVWEQGRFIRFHGVAQWISWLWPVVMLGYLLRVTVKGPKQPGE